MARTQALILQPWADAFCEHKNAEKCVCDRRPGLQSGPAGWVYSAPQDLAGFRGPLPGGEGPKGKRREWMGRGREKRGREGREWEGGKFELGHRLAKTENAGHENDGPSKLQDMKLQGMKLQDKISTILSTQEAQKRAWPHGTSATPEQTHLTPVVYSCCRCRRWRESGPSRCSRWCRGWWQVVCVIFVAGGFVVVSHWLDYFLCAQAGDLSPICCDLP